MDRSAQFDTYDKSNFYFHGIVTAKAPGLIQISEFTKVKKRAA
jgi:hypothetical protein